MFWGGELTCTLSRTDMCIFLPVRIVCVFSVLHEYEECNNACDDELCKHGRKQILQTKDRGAAQWESQQGGKLFYVCHLHDY